MTVTAPYTPYYPAGWQDTPDTSTPITAAALQNMETGIGNASIWLSVKAYGAVGDGAHDDTAAIQNAINAAAPGQVVFLPPGLTYLVTAPLTMRHGVLLKGGYAFINPLGQPISGSVLKVSSAFAGSLAGGNSAVIWVPDPNTSGSGISQMKCGIQGIEIDASPTWATNTFDGILIYGAAGSVIENVVVTNATGWGIRAIPYTGGSTFYFPDLVKIRCSAVHQCKAGGIQLHNCPDTTCTDVYSFVNNHDAWDITPGGNTTLIGCRGEDSVQIGSNGAGFNINGNSTSGNPGAGVNLIGCSTQDNGYAGVVINNTQLVNICGGTFDGDGNGTGGTGAGIYITGQTRPVNITGIQRTAPAAPASGGDWAISVNGTSKQIYLASSTLVGATAPYKDDGSGNTVGYGPGLMLGTGSGPTWQMPPSQSSGWTAGELGYAGVPYDPVFQSNGGTSRTLVAGSLNLIGVQIREPRLLSAVDIYVIAAGAGLTASENFIGVYDSTGVLRGETGDLSAVWNSTGWKDSEALTATAAGLFVQPGEVWIAALPNGTTPPSLSAVNASPNIASQILNGHASASKCRYGLYGSALTSLPATITPSAITLTQVAAWFAGVH